MADKFEQWCIVEIMGHQRYAGYVTEQTVGGQAFVRLDVPEAEGLPAFSKLFGASSIYCITPVSEEVAKMTARGLKKTVLNVYDLPDEIRRTIQAMQATARLASPADDEAYDDDATDDPLDM